MTDQVERTNRLPLAIGSEVLNKITAAESLKEAGDIVMAHDVEQAVSIIDNLDPLTAAFVLIEVSRLSSLEDCSTVIRNRMKHAKKILARARELKTRGINGLCYARDQVFRETGYFAGI